MIESIKNYLYHKMIKWIFKMILFICKVGLLFINKYYNKIIIYDLK